MHGRQHGTTRSSQQGHLHLFCTRVSLCFAEELLFDMYHSYRAASWGRWGWEGGKGRGRQERGRGVDQSQRMTSGAATNLGFEWPVTSHSTATLEAVSGRREQKKKRKVTKGNKREPERGGEPRFHVSSRKAVHREEETGRRIDWRWWTINEVIDPGVRVAGWGLEINWNKHINTSSILHPKHTHTLSRIYYEPCLA